MGTLADKDGGQYVYSDRSKVSQERALGKEKLLNRGSLMVNTLHYQLPHIVCVRLCVESCGDMWAL